jgi:hypothetical protein
VASGKSVESSITSCFALLCFALLSAAAAAAAAAATATATATAVLLTDVPTLDQLALLLKIDDSSNAEQLHPRADRLQLTELEACRRGRSEVGARSQT